MVLEKSREGIILSVWEEILQNKTFIQLSKLFVHLYVFSAIGQGQVSISIWL